MVRAGNESRSASERVARGSLKSSGAALARDVTLGEIPVAGATGRPRQQPDRLLADKGYLSRANRAWLRERGHGHDDPGT